MNDAAVAPDDPAPVGIGNHDVTIIVCGAPLQQREISRIEPSVHGDEDNLSSLNGESSKIIQNATVATNQETDAPKWRIKWPQLVAWCDEPFVQVEDLLLAQPDYGE